MNRLLKIYTIGVFLFLYSPITILVLYSFNENKYTQDFNSLSLKWYSELLNDSALISALQNSLVVALVAASCSVLLAIPAAFALFQKQTKLNVKINNFLQLVLVTPDISLAIGLMFLLQTFRFSLGLNTVIIAHITFGVVFALIIISAKFQALDKNIVKAALDLGATNFQTLRLVIIPNILPSILAAFFICFTLSWDDFVFSFFNTSAGQNTLPVQIFAMIKRGINPQINAIATISMIFSFILIYIGLKFQRIINLF